MPAVLGVSIRPGSKLVHQTRIDYALKHLDARANMVKAGDFHEPKNFMELNVAISDRATT